ncbi:sso1426 family CRISPR-associated ramp protein [Dorea sp. 5-2]|nr:sso1426 family CRISPR-associated ramp protein [Dorea sp. 5-2]
MFHKFINRYVITGELEAVTALHVGAAEDVFKPNGCKNPFFRNADGKPLIPGSSLKGAMRSFLEQYLSSDSGSAIIPDNIHYRRSVCSADHLCADHLCADHKTEADLKKPLRSNKAENEKELSEYLFGVAGDDKKRGKLCIVCRLFGSRYSAAKFSIRDAGVDDSFEDEFEIRSGVAIDRNFGTSVGGNKFETEVVPKGTKFSFRAILENGDDTEWMIIRQLLMAMHLNMIPIGGMKSRGLGEIRLQKVLYQKISQENIADYLSGKEIKFTVLNEASREA